MNTIPFQFNRQIDADLLYSLYESDYLYIEEIFNITLTHYDEDVDVFATHHHTGNLDGLKRAVHKLKPVFGFVAMPGVEQCCIDFEEKYTRTTDMRELRTDSEKLLHRFKESKKILKEDLQKLSAHNKNTE